MGRLHPLADLVEMLDRIALLPLAQILEQRRDMRAAVTLEQECDVDIAVGEGGFAIDALVDALHRERDPFRVEAGALAPRGGRIAALGAGRDGLVDRMRHDRQLRRARLRDRWRACRGGAEDAERTSDNLPACGCDIRHLAGFLPRDCAAAT